MRASDGVVVATYTYDAWGKCSVRNSSGTTIGTANPFRYKGYYFDDETGMYYLNSRYFSPTFGRFISADRVMSCSDVNGMNLYAYCKNNPINYDDKYGTMPKFIKSSIKWVTKHIFQPITNKLKKVFSKESKTESVGVNASATPSIFSFNAQLGISMDRSGNVAMQSAFYGGVTLGTPGAMASFYHTETNAPSIYNLEGMGYQIGASAAGGPLFAAVGTELNIIPDNLNDKNYFGRTINLGIGTPSLEAHIEWGNTTTINIFEFNIYDKLDKTYTMIMEW